MTKKKGHSRVVDQLARFRAAAEARGETFDEAFESAVRADERRKVVEECARVAELVLIHNPQDGTLSTRAAREAATDIASAIRALKGAGE